MPSHSHTRFSRQTQTENVCSPCCCRCCCCVSQSTAVWFLEQGYHHTILLFLRGHVQILASPASDPPPTKTTPVAPALRVKVHTHFHTHTRTLLLACLDETEDLREGVCVRAVCLSPPPSLCFALLSVSPSLSHSHMHSHSPCPQPLPPSSFFLSLSLSLSPISPPPSLSIDCQHEGWVCASSAETSQIGRAHV